MGFVLSVREGAPFDASIASRTEDADLANDGSVVVVMVGYIDNLAEVLRHLGDPSAGISDATVLLRAYRRWGAAFAERVSGPYAFGLIDRVERRALVGRDALGLTRMLVREAPGRTWFGTDMAELLACLSGRPSLDPRGLAAYLSGGGLMGGERTAWSSIRQVPPAHLILHDGLRSRQIRTWTPTPEAPLGSTEETDERLRELLFDAVGASMRSRTPVWCDLSGGLDSSTVAAVAARWADQTGGPRPIAFSVVHPTTTDADESSYQEALAQHVGLLRRPFDADRWTDFDAIDLDDTAEPSNGILQGGRARAVRAAHRESGVRVRLTGFGGDQVFSGDAFPPVSLATALRSGDVSGWVRELRAWLVRGERSLWDLVWTCTRTPLDADRTLGTPLPSWLSPGVRDEIRAARLVERRRPSTFRDGATELQWRDIQDFAPCLRPPRTFEGRHPLLHRALVSFVLGLRWKDKVAPDRDRIVQRRALHGILPEVVRTRAGKGDGTPRFLRGLRENWDAVVRPLSEGRHLAALGLVDRPAFELGIQRLRHGLMGDDLPLFVAALSLEAWLSVTAAT